MLMALNRFGHLLKDALLNLKELELILIYILKNTNGVGIKNLRYSKKDYLLLLTNITLIH